MKRSLNCDILRILAFCFVISVHFLLYNNFYITQTSGETMLVVNILRCLFITCVPLFLILSGYLMNKKSFSKQYCKNISKILLTYVLCSIACIICINLTLGNVIPSPKEIVIQIFGFVGTPYAWYVNMYIGLYFFIPFLNSLWNSLDKTNKKALIVILFIFVISPTFFNLRMNIIPYNWCGVAYPILYYFIGCYLNEFPLKISTFKNLIILLLLVVAFGLFNFHMCYNKLFESGLYSEYFSFQAFFVSLFLANLVINLKIKIKSERLNKFIVKLSKLTFGGYLVSAIFDNLFYSKVMPHLGVTFHERLRYIIPFVLVIIICSLFGAYLIDLIEILFKKFVCILEKIKNKVIIYLKRQKR